MSVSTLFMTLYTSLSTLHQNTQHIYLFSLQWFLNILQQTLLEYSALKNGNPANGHHPVSSQSSQRKESDQQIYKLLLQQVLVEMYTEKNIILVKDRLVLPVLLYVNALLTKNVITLQDVRLWQHLRSIVMIKCCCNNSFLFFFSSFFFSFSFSLLSPASFYYYFHTFNLTPGTILSTRQQ